MSQQNLQVVRGLYDAFNRGDLDTFSRGLAANLEWAEAENSLWASAQPQRSFAAIQSEVLGPITRDFDGFTCKVEQYLDAGDQIVTTGRYGGKCKETGNSLSAQFCHILHLDPDGKVDGFREYCDTMAEAEATGWARPIGTMQVPQSVM
ncbi:nuclear transport factor 2 family protein [Sphingomonas sp. GCM10030256]|uniref:nuclear transport factor 2 family protein n=1 Tax=Sphingomonas sp. GCM10030256 TaxID=3273427 RepID=UPI0036085D84